MSAILAYLTAHANSSHANIRKLPGALRTSMKQRQGFTLVELMIFIAILFGLLVALVLVVIAILAGLKYLEVI